VLSKLAVAPAARGARIVRSLVCEAYRRLTAHGTQVASIGCGPHLERFYLRLGFLPHGPLQLVPGYGAILPMRLDLLDLPHLQQVGSPLASLCAARHGGSRRSA
jgi:predicted N-acetyltransferase YhbS